MSPFTNSLSCGVGGLPTGQPIQADGQFTRQPTSLNGRNFRQAGLTMIEAIAFLGIAGLVMAGALAMYNSARTSMDVAQVKEEYFALKDSIEHLFTGSNGYISSNAIETLINAKKIPVSLVVSGTIVTNKWDGKLEVRNGVANYRITFDNIPKGVCVGMLPAITAPGGWGGYNVVAAGSFVGMETVTTGKIAPDVASNICFENSKVSIWTAPLW